MHKYKIGFLGVLSIFLFSSIVTAQTIKKSCWSALNGCIREASVLYPYDGQIMDPKNPPKSYQAQEYCKYLHLQCLNNNKNNPNNPNPIRDLTMMDQLKAIFNGYYSDGGSSTIGATYSSCMIAVTDSAYCKALFPTTDTSIETQRERNIQIYKTIKRKTQENKFKPCL